MAWRQVISPVLESFTLPSFSIYVSNNEHDKYSSLINKALKSRNIEILIICSTIPKTAFILSYIKGCPEKGEPANNFLIIYIKMNEFRLVINLSAFLFFFKKTL